MRMCCVLSDGFEDLEAIGTVALLRRAGLTVDYVTLKDDPDEPVRGSHGTNVLPDGRMSDCTVRDYDGLFLPGGPHAKTLRENESLLGWVREFRRAGKWLAAICAAPSVFGTAGIMADVRYTSFPGTGDFLPDAIRVSAPVVRDGTIITGKGAGVVIDFALTVIEAMLGRDAARDVRQRIQYHEDEEK